MHPMHRSLLMRHVDAGSCNGCEQELTAIAGPDYDMQHWGIDIVASPRHADVLVVTGPVTDTMESALQHAWDAVPRPKKLVAVGDCAAGTGVFQGAYACHGGVRAADAVVLGCPPTPGAILDHLRRLAIDWDEQPTREGR